MSYDLKLDERTHDIMLPTRLLSGRELIRQRIRIRFETGTGEWFKDPLGTGLPFIGWLEQKPLPLVEIANSFALEAEEVDGVVATQDFDASVGSDRIVRITGEIYYDPDFGAGEEPDLVVIETATPGVTAYPFTIWFDMGGS